MEAATSSNVPQEEGDSIRLICERKEELNVARSLLIGSSTYFAAMLSEESGWQESSSREIELEGWSRNDLSTIVLSLETKDPKPILADLDRYFIAINYFSITPLMEQCIDFKIQNISDESVVDDLSFAERFSIDELREKCTKYLLRRLPEVLRSSPETNRRMSAELLQKLLRDEKLAVRNEDEILSMIDLWCSSGDRQSERAKLLQEVRFAHLTGSVFEKCRQDAQCQEVPQFRLLLETDRWSDLGEDFLSRRSSSRVHYHAAGFLKSSWCRETEALLAHDRFALGMLVHCSETGVLSMVFDAFSEVCATSMVDRFGSVMYGNELYACQRPERSYILPGGRRKPFYADCFNGFKHYADFRDAEPSLIVEFPHLIYPTAPPVVFKNELIIVHLLNRSEPIPGQINYFLRTENFEELEILRYHNGKASSRRLPVPIKFEPAWRANVYHDFVLKGANKLLVNDEWTILTVANQGVLFVIDAPHPVGPLIEIPEKFWKFEVANRYLHSTFSNVVIVGNVAYVLLEFHFHQERFRPRDGSWIWSHEVREGSITAYDLDEGKWLPEHFVDLATIDKEKRTFGRGHGEERFEFHLKVVQNEVFLIALSDRVEARESSFPVAAINYAYRVERSADGLCISPVSDSAAATVKKDRDSNEGFTSTRWLGIPFHVDAHPCEYATALQLKASREKDPDERQRLRRFIW